MTRWVCVSFRENSGLNVDGVQRHRFGIKRHGGCVEKRGKNEIKKKN